MCFTLSGMQMALLAILTSLPWVDSHSRLQAEMQAEGLQRHMLWKWNWERCCVSYMHIVIVLNVGNSHLWSLKRLIGCYPHFSDSAK